MTNESVSGEATEAKRSMVARESGENCQSDALAMCSDVRFVSIPGLLVIQTQFATGLITLFLLAEKFGRNDSQTSYRQHTKQSIISR